ATPSVATISVNGLATGLASGTSAIGATRGGVSGGMVLTVNPAALLAIAVTPARASLPQGETQPFTALGTLPHHSAQDVTGQVVWVSANPVVAEVSAAGVATGLAQGVASIIATSDGVTGATVLTIGSAVLRSLVVTPASASVPQGETLQFIATGTFSD